MRLVFLGSPPFATTVLEHLFASEFRPELIVTPPARRQGRGRKLGDSLVAELAHAADIDCLQPESVRDEAFLERLRAVEADVFLVVSYGELLRQEFLDIPREVNLNVHPSLLPRWRGASPIQAAIRAGDAETGVSIQKVVLELDAGDVSCSARSPSCRARPPVSSPAGWRSCRASSSSRPCAGSPTARPCTRRRTPKPSPSASASRRSTGRSRYEIATVTIVKNASAIKTAM